MKTLILFLLTLFINPITIQSQVVINELFADPSPSVGLPEEEFLELYNISDSAISLQGWEISDASTSKTIETDYMLEANSYIILCADEHEDLFTPYGNIVTVSTLPSLNNSGDEISLRNTEGEVIDFVHYDSSWYNDVLKDDGGWTLERINPENICDAASNWSASNATQGGTPGQVNSIFDITYQNNSLLEVRSVFLYENETLAIEFSKSPKYEMAINYETYDFTPLLEINEILHIDNIVTIKFSESIEENQIYELSINNLEDCQGISSISGEYLFGITQTPQRGEILINEILFNPASGGVDFIEIINVSNKLFSLDNLSVLELDVFNDSVVDFETISSTKQYLFPDAYYVLTSDITIINELYQVINPENLIEVNIPNYADEQGKLAILNQQLDTIDILKYSEEWHFELLNRLDGVSLERLSIDLPTQDKNNWFSASYLAGNATPTSKNSQNLHSIAPIDQNLILSNEIFSPDGDGFNDFLTINFNENEIGNTVSLSVFNTRGFLINTLVNNQLIGAQNQIRWTGLNQEEKPVAIGHYFIVAEIYSPEGDRKILKQKVVVSRAY